MLIKFLNQQAADRAWLDAALLPPPSYDVNDDGDVTAVDVLSVINGLNGVPTPAAEGEGKGGASLLRSDVAPTGWLVGRGELPAPSADDDLPVRPACLPVASQATGRNAGSAKDSSTATLAGTRRGTQRAALASANRRWNADHASPPEFFDELDLSEPPWDAILSAIT